MVYKLVAREGRDGVMAAVAKKSKDKVSVGGRKYAMRRRTPDGVAEAEVIGLAPPDDDGNDRPLLVPLVREGEMVGREPLAVARERHAVSRAELPRTALQMSRGEPAIPTVYEGES
jgi:nicotinate phosphoribosyltransferase